MAFTAVTNNIDWQALAFLNEYVGAQRERAAVADIPQMTLVVAGDDIQSAVGSCVIPDLQGSFTALVTAGVWAENTLSNYNGEVAVTGITTLSQLKTLAGIGTGFRRSTTIPRVWTDYNDAAFSYGGIQAGDIIGPWLFADLQLMFKELSRTFATATSNDYTNGIYRGLDWPGSGTWALSQSACDADWHYTTGLYGDYFRNYSWGQLAGGAYSSERSHRTRKINFPSHTSPLNRDCTAYLVPTKPGATANDIWDTQGTRRENGDAIVADVYNAMIVETHDGTGGAPTFPSTGAVGDVAPDTKPAWCLEPDIVDTWHSLGWKQESGDVMTTSDWDFAYK